MTESSATLSYCKVLLNNADGLSICVPHIKAPVSPARHGRLVISLSDMRTASSALAAASTALHTLLVLLLLQVTHTASAVV